MKNDPNVSRGEFFIGANLIGKIGVLFIIAGVIAFSAASYGYIHDGVRLVMVFAVGVIMLSVGEVFFRRGSKTFSSALIFGGTAELFISGLIGYYGLKILNNYTVIIAAVLTAAAGIFLSLRYSSQALLAVTVIFSVLPVFAGSFSGRDSAVPYMIIAVYYIGVHCFCVVISRIHNYKASSFIGLSVAVIEAMLVPATFLLGTELDYRSAFIFSAVFICCAAVIYSSAPLMNALENGRLSGTDTVQFMTVQCFTLGLVQIFLYFGVRTRITGITLAVFAVFFALAAISAALRFRFKSGLCSVLTNTALAALSIGLVDIFSMNVLRYIVIHVFGMAVLSAGIILKRRLFRNWGLGLLIFAETLFITLAPIIRGNTINKIGVFIVNMTIWLLIMVILFISGKNNSISFRIYSTAVLVNTGLLIQNIIFTVINEYYRFIGSFTQTTYSVMLCAMMWLVLTFVTGKIKSLKLWGTVSSFCFFGLGILMLFAANVNNLTLFSRDILKPHFVAVTIIVNVVSVLLVLDIALKIQTLAPKFSCAFGLVISAYSLYTLIVLLGTNNFVPFTSFIISIICIAAAIMWIVFGFWKRNPLLRIFGLALILLSSAKLFLFDFIGINPVGRTLLFIIFGITLLSISFGYGIAEKSFKKRRR